MAEETFGKRLKRLREEAGLTQQQLADGAGVHRISVAKLEQDQYSPTWNTVLALVKAMGCTLAAFEGAVTPTEEQKSAPRKRGRPRKAPPAEPEQESEAKPSGKKRKKKQ